MSPQSRTRLPHLTVAERREYGAVTLRLSGDLDLAGAEVLQAHLTGLQRTFRGRLVIDLRGLELLTSAGIAVLVAAEAYARRDGWLLELRQGGPHIRSVFELCGMLDELPFVRFRRPTRSAGA